MPKALLGVAESLNPKNAFRFFFVGFRTHSDFHSLFFFFFSVFYIFVRYPHLFFFEFRYIFPLLFFYSGCDPVPTWALGRPPSLSRGLKSRRGLPLRSRLCSRLSGGPPCGPAASGACRPRSRPNWMRLRQSSSGQGRCQTTLRCLHRYIDVRCFFFFLCSWYVDSVLFFGCLVCMFCVYRLCSSFCLSHLLIMYRVLACLLTHLLAGPQACWLALVFALSRLVNPSRGLAQNDPRPIYSSRTFRRCRLTFAPFSHNSPPPRWPSSVFGPCFYSCPVRTVSQAVRSHW